MQSSHHELLAVLVDHDVDFVLVGGAAMRVRGIGRTTDDVDVMIASAQDNLRQLEQALTALRARPSAIVDIGIRYLTAFGRLDVLQRRPGSGTTPRGCRTPNPSCSGRTGRRVRVAALDAVDRDKAIIDRVKDREAREWIARFREDREAVTAPSAAERLLGPPPRDERQRRQWTAVARMVDHFRRTHAVDTEEPLGGADLDGRAAAERKRIVTLARRLERSAQEMPGTEPPGPGGIHLDLRRGRQPTAATPRGVGPAWSSRRARSSRRRLRSCSHARPRRSAADRARSPRAVEPR